MRITNPKFANTPPNWAACDAALARFEPIERIGFKGRPGDLRRFCSRYRLAKSFQGVTLDSYSPETVRGYSALTKIFLTYSAFEQFMKVCDLKINSIPSILPANSLEELSAKIRAVPEWQKFLEFLVPELEDGRPHKKNLMDFLAGQSSNPLYIPAGIRHIFAHGILTPHSGTGATDVPHFLSNILCDYLFEVMDAQFKTRLRV